MTSRNLDYLLPLETEQEVVGGYADCNQVIHHRYEVKTPRKEVASVVRRHAAAVMLVQVRKCFPLDVLHLVGNPTVNQYALNRSTNVRTFSFCENSRPYRPVNHWPTVQAIQNVRRKVPKFLFRPPIPCALWTSLRNIAYSLDVLTGLPEPKDRL